MKLSLRIEFRTFVLLAVLALFTPRFTQASQPAAKSGTLFAPLQQWKDALIGNNLAALRALYSTSPSAHVVTPAGESSADADISFWTGLKARGIKLDIIQSGSPQAGVYQVVFQAQVRTALPAEHTLYITEGQLWQQQGETWRLAAVKRSDATRLQQPTSISKVIYAPGIDAHAEINRALALASREHRHVLVIFGANWCYDCHVLDLAFHRPDVEGVVQRYYEVVHVDVGEGDKNQDLMQQYQVPMKKGIPAIAVLDSDGKLLYSQQRGEFEKARALAPEDVLAFLNKWKPAGHRPS